MFIVQGASPVIFNEDECQMFCVMIVRQALYLSFINEAEKSCDVIKVEDNEKISSTEESIQNKIHRSGGRGIVTTSSFRLKNL